MSSKPHGRRLQIAVGALLAVAAVAAVVIAAVTGGGTNGKPRAHGPATISNVAIPAPANTNLRAAAAAAGCALLSPPSEGREHVLGSVQYRTNPPSSGPHYPMWAHDGIYAPGSTPPKERLVHSLEHGRVEVQYQPGTSTAVIGALQSLVTEFATHDSDPRVLLFQNTTAMPYAVAAVAWTHILGCNRYAGAATLDALRDFRSAYDLKGPERFFVDAE